MGNNNVTSSLLKIFSGGTNALKEAFVVVSSTEEKHDAVLRCTSPSMPDSVLLLLFCLVFLVMFLLSDLFFESKKEQKITELKTQLSTKEEKIVTMQEEWQRLRAGNTDFKEALVSKDQEITELETELLTKDEELVTMQEKCQHLRAENTDLKEARGSKVQKITELETEVVTKDEELVTITEECQRLRAENVEFKEARGSATTATVVEDRRNNNNNDADYQGLGRAVLEVLGNLTVTDVMHDNKVMRRLLVNKLLRVTVTGPNGTPVYYQSTFWRGAPMNVQGEDHWVVKWDKDDPNYASSRIPLHLFRGMEIWSGDTFLHRLNLRTSLIGFSAKPRAGYDLKRLDVPQMGTVQISTDLGQSLLGPVPQIVAKIGPILYNDFTRVIPEMNDTTRRMSMEQFVTLYQNTPLQFSIVGLLLRNTYVGGAISILEGFGHSTTTNDNDNDNHNDNDNGNGNGNDNGNGNGNGNDNGNGNGNGNGNDNNNGNDNGNDNGIVIGNGNEEDN